MLLAMHITHRVAFGKTAKECQAAKHWQNLLLMLSLRGLFADCYSHPHS
jgi:hypothetical protein